MTRRRRHRRPEGIRLDDETVRIAIVGAGLAGLSTAMALERAGFTNLQVFEKRASTDSYSGGGYGLTLTYHPAGALAQLGVLDDVADQDCPSRSHYLFDCEGHILGYFGNAFSAKRGWGQRGNLRVPRQTVRQILLDQLKCTVVHWNHELVNVRETESSSCVELVFRRNDSDSTTVQADICVAADGIRSAFVRTWLPQAPLPQPMGIRLILGLTRGFQHPLLCERGFYTLAPGKRLFVMPYTAPSVHNQTADVRYMWQMSFCADGTTTRSSPDALLQEALHLTQAWHEPVQSMIRSTPLESVWGTHLCDRDPAVLQRLLLQKQESCHCTVVVVGDALHAMSPFKGQGANQSLRDGLVVAQWFQRTSSPRAAVRGCLREMVHRTHKVVAASRQAAHYWHSAAAVTDRHAFAGVVDAALAVDALREAQITAATSDLDDCIARVLESSLPSTTTPAVPHNNNNNNNNNNSTSGKGTKSAQQAAVTAVAAGDRGRLRQLSWEQPNLLRDMGATLVDLARDERTKHWLVTEAGCTL